MGDMKWRQIKMFGMEAHRILAPELEFKSSNIPGLFGIEEDDLKVTEAHTKAAKAEVTSWKNKPEAADKITERVAWWLALGDALVVAGIGPHQTDRKDAQTGMSAAIDYAKRTRHAKDPRTGRPLAVDVVAKGFLTRAGFDSSNFALPQPAPTEVAGGNPFAHTKYTGFGPLEQQTQTVVQTTVTNADPDLTRIASAMKAAGYSPAEVAAALAERMAG